jgi:hypothetical protein
MVAIGAATWELSRWSARSAARTNDLDGDERRHRIHREDRPAAAGTALPATPTSARTGPADDASRLTLRAHAP